MADTATEIITIDASPERVWDIAVDIAIAWRRQCAAPRYLRTQAGIIMKSRFLG